MATTHYTVEQVSTTVDSAVSSPRSDNLSIDNNRVYDDPAARVRFMCSFGGKILPRPHDNQLRYVGGDTRMVTVLRHNTTFASLLNKLSKLSGTTDVCIKYQLPNEDLDALITVTSDEDVENMMDEYDRLAHNQKTARLRIFLFPTDLSLSLSRASSISSLLDGSIKREHWFLDALNGGTSLDRGRSEVSSIVSEVPDYLFGLDHPDAPKPKTKPMVNDNVSVSDPGSPAPRMSSPYCSTSSSLGPTTAPPIPNLRPVKTKLDNPPPVVSEPKETVNEHFAEANDLIISKQTDYTGQPMYYIRQTSSPAPVQEMPVYYMHPPGSMPQENIPVQPVPIRAQYGQQFIAPPGQMFHHHVSNMGQVYSGLRPASGGESHDMPGRSGGGPVQPVYYGPRYVGVPGYPGMVLPGAEEMKQSGPEGKMGRAPQ
ncbi:hypothetical protein L1987_28423 [Smallanthus sonchifolius]|uniref:Uncharacterized protein n=1 Tax=Smallanthus sonchifolius TaxID=185202 RepID=A0ACB9HWI7_9ASTR|nr:hypothetical protein L1987_28423 [Smallanthus sonchifolius]